MDNFFIRGDTNQKKTRNFFLYRCKTINLLVNKVYNARNNLNCYSPSKNSSKKKVEKSDILKKFFLGKTQKRMVFNLSKDKFGVGLYFLGAL
jgi:hypothetical protein